MGIVLGSVPYLNARPLIRWFDSEEGRASKIQVIEKTPSRLATMLADGEIDAALVSVFASFVHPEFVTLPGVSISGQGEIKSVRAFSRLPFGMAQSIAMDTSSLTSVALLTILLSELYNAHPAAIHLEPDLQTMLARADAALLIGDPGMLADDRGLRVLDLGEGWRNLTGLPFTYAVWLCRPESVSDDLIATLNHARDYGLAQAGAIAREEASRLGCSYEMCYDYITDVMDYDLGPEHQEAISTFYKKCREMALLTR